MDQQDEDARRIADVRERVRAEHLEPILKVKATSDENFLMGCLKNHFVFYNLN